MVQEGEGGGDTWILKKGMGGKWRRIARYRLGKRIKEGMYWAREKERMCRMCGREEEMWKHVWKNCGRWEADGSLKEMVKEVMGVKGAGEGWLKKIRSVQRRGRVCEKWRGERACGEKRE